MDNRRVFPLFFHRFDNGPSRLRDNCGPQAVENGPEASGACRFVTQGFRALLQRQFPLSLFTLH